MATEKRLIDANSLIEKFNDHKDLFLNKMGGFQALLQREKGRVDELDNCIADVINAPTVDAVEVVHGHWFWAEDAYIYCSECKQKAPVIPQYQNEPMTSMTNYCPHCGAKMDGDGNG